MGRFDRRIGRLFDGCSTSSSRLRENNLPVPTTFPMPSMSRPFDDCREGERVYLRPPERSDEARVLELRRASWGELSPWEPTPEPGQDPLSSAWFREYLDRSRLSSNATFLLCQRIDDQPIGHLGLGVITKGRLMSAYAGYWIATAFGGQGLMTEGLECLVDVAFREIGLHRVEANIRPENARSIRLVSRLGFSKEGFSPRYLHIDGDWRDHER